MNHTILPNSSAAYEPLAPYSINSIAMSTYTVRGFDLQSSSITSIGHQWQFAHRRSQGTRSSTRTPVEPEEEATTPSSEQVRKTMALIQLFKSWREEDEQEQKETWEQLKQVLDEDRLSDRKLFP